MHWRQLRNGGTALALLVTFTLSGLWHGASWNYIAWGVLHGLMLAASVFYRPWQKKLQHLLGLHKARFLPLWQRFVTFHLVSLAWILFRSDSLEQTWDMLRGIAGLAQQGSAGIQPAIQQCSQLLAMAGSDQVLQPLLFSVALLLYTGIGWLRPVNIPRLQPLQRWSLYLLLLGGILLLRVPANSDFIYFRF
jgi:hypothetical protein